MADSDEAGFLYNSQLDAFDLYHIVQEETRPRRAPLGPALPALGHATSGALGSAISKLIIYPLDLVITRLQVQAQFKNGDSEGEGDDDADYKDIVDALKKIYAKEGGLPAFYSGLAQDLIKSVADSFLFFLAYNFVKSSRQARKPDPKKALPAFEEIAVGMVAGAFSKFWTTPVQNIVTRKQTASMVAARDRTSSVSPELSARDIALQIRHEKGVGGFWSGYSAALILTLNPALTFLLHESLLRVLVPRAKRAKPGSTVTFFIAALSKVVASTITYPVSLAKTRAQVSAQPPTSTAGEEPLQENQGSAAKETEPLQEKAAAAGSAATRETKRAAARATIFGSILAIARKEGTAGLYQGLGGEVFKGFFSHGLTMLMKERIHVLVIQLYYLILKALRRYPSPQELAVQAQEEMREAVEAGRELVSSTSQKMAEALENKSTQLGDVYGKSVERAAELVTRESGKASVNSDRPKTKE